MSELKDRLIAALDQAVAGRASQLLLTRLRRSVDQAGEDDAGLEECVRRVRVALRIFVDESVADSVEATLRGIITTHKP